jgi:hypothetical protein
MRRIDKTITYYIANNDIIDDDTNISLELKDI